MISHSPASSEQVSRLLGYLPSIYRQDEFLGRFLQIFEDILTPIENTIDGLPGFFDPLITSPEFIPWLSSLMDIANDEAVPMSHRRQLLFHAAHLYRFRGTRLALEQALSLALGVKPTIEEGPGSFVISFESTDTNIDLAARIAETQRPAHIRCEIRVGAATDKRAESTSQQAEEETKE